MSACQLTARARLTLHAGRHSTRSALFWRMLKLEPVWTCGRRSAPGTDGACSGVLDCVAEYPTGTSSSVQLPLLAMTDAHLFFFRGALCLCLTPSHLRLPDASKSSPAQGSEYPLVAQRRRQELSSLQWTLRSMQRTSSRCSERVSAFARLIGRGSGLLRCSSRLLLGGGWWWGSSSCG